MRGKSQAFLRITLLSKRYITLVLQIIPDMSLAKTQGSGFGGMISFDIGSEERVDAFLGNLKLFTIAESLGAVESLISVPARMTHASIPRERRLEPRHYGRLDQNFCRN